MSLIGKFATVGGATMASRVLGFVREALIGAALGAGPVADAFYAALRFPNLFRRMLAEGAFNAAFIPLFSSSLETGGHDAAHRFAKDVFSVLFAFLIAFSALAIIIMPVLVATVIAPKFADTPEKFDLTVTMTRIMFPYLFCMSLVAMMSGILNSLRHYFLAAIVPVLLNIILIAVLVAALWAGAPQWFTGLAMAWGVFASGFAQLAFLILGVRKQGFFLRPRMPRMTKEVRSLLVLMGPVLLTNGVTQINLLVGQIIASAQDGAIALLNYADRLNQLPLGIIGIAVGVVLLPELSRALKADDSTGAAHLQNRSLEFAMMLTLPAAIGFVLMPEPIVSLLYERGAFDPETTRMTASALAAFATGLPAYVLIKVFQPVFYARQLVKAPFWFSLISVAVNIAVSLALFPRYGHVAVAIATSVASWINLLLLAGTLWGRNHFRPSPTTWRRLAAIVFAGIVMGAVIVAANAGLDRITDSSGFLVRFVTVIGVVLLAAIVYLGLVLGLKGIDPAELKALRRRRSRPVTRSVEPDA